MTNRVFTRALCALALLFGASSAARAIDVTVAGTSFGGYNYSGATAKLRIYAGETFLASDSTVVPGGTAPGSTAGFFTTVNCTVASETLTCPSVTLKSTTDSLDKPGVTYTAVLFDAAGARREFFPISEFRLAHTLGAATTWAAVINDNAGTRIYPHPGYYTVDQTNAQIASALVSANETSVRSYSSFAAAVAAIGAAETTLLVDTAAAVSSSLTVPATLALRFTGAGKITVASGQTLTIAGSLSAPPKQIFAGSGVVRFAGNKAVSVFPVRWWGAQGDGATDDTDEIQAVIDALDASDLWGTVLFHNGVYVVGGPLRACGTGSDAQLCLPIRTGGLGGNQFAIRLKGEAPVSNLGTDLSTGGALVKSTLSSGTGALIGGRGTAPLYINPLTVYVEDLNFRLPQNPTNSALDFHWIANAFLENIKVDASARYNEAAQPTTASSYGVKMPGNNVVSKSYARNVAVAGFYNGFEWNELSDGDSIIAVNCYNGLTLPAAYHAVRIGVYEDINNRRGISFPGLPVSGSDAEFGQQRLKIEFWSTEHTQDSSAWFYREFDIYDPNHYGHGEVWWHAVEQNVGSINLMAAGVNWSCSAGGASRFTVCGGGNLRLRTLYPSGTALYAGDLATKPTNFELANNADAAGTINRTPRLSLVNRQTGTAHPVASLIGSNLASGDPDIRLGSLNVLTDGAADRGAVGFNTNDGAAFAERWRITSAGNLQTSSPGVHLNQSAANSDLAGTISLSAATSGGKTFATAFTSAPACVVMPQFDVGVGVRWWATMTTTAVTVNTSAAVTGTFSYFCPGNPN